jgi:hypothetical protein
VRRAISVVALACSVVLPLGSAAGSIDPAAAATPVGPSARAASSTGLVTGQQSKPLRGADISWPNCKKGMGIPSRRTKGRPMPYKSSKFVVIGLTNGPAYYPNPCLASQVAWAKRHHVYTAPYSFTTYPTKAQLKKYGSAGPWLGVTKRKRLLNAGFAQAQFNLANMRRAGLVAPFVWVDVEYSRSPAKWSHSRSSNRAVLEGVLAGYRAGGLRVGVYSSEYPWRDLVGKVRYHLPEWRTVGPASKAKALRKCHVRSTQGGRIVLTQWWHDEKRDFDVTCPAFSSPKQLNRYFHKY